MVHLKLLVVGLSALLSTAAAVAVEKRGGLNDVGIIVDIIKDLDLYDACAWFFHLPEYPHTVTHYVGTRTVTVSGTVTITNTLTQTYPSGTLDVTDFTTETETITYTAASETSIHGKPREEDRLLTLDSHRHRNRSPLDSVGAIDRIQGIRLTYR
jgi:hypothetical protein